MEHEEALQRLRQLEGSDLVALAAELGVTVWKGNRKNRGWAGHVLEHYLGLPLNSARSPNFGSWELKVVSLKHGRDGRIVVKETMQITMIDAWHVARTPFEESHLLSKLRKAIVCGRLWHGADEHRSELVRVESFDLMQDSQLLEEIRQDYELVRQAINERGFEALTGRMGRWVQPRTKGPGHGSTSRAFYARTCLVRRILHLDRLTASDK